MRVTLTLGLRKIRTAQNGGRTGQGAGLNGHDLTPRKSSSKAKISTRGGKRMVSRGYGEENDCSSWRVEEPSGKRKKNEIQPRHGTAVAKTEVKIEDQI